MSTLIYDIRFALRLLLRQPLFTTVAVVALALGIGATTSIFSVANALLIRDLPVDDPSSLVSISLVDRENTPYHAVSYPEYRDLRDRTRSLAGLVSFTDASVSFSTGGQPERMLGTIVSGNYFEVLGIEPAVGRFFGAGEDRVAGASPVVVLGYSVWQQRFDGKPSVVGRSVLLNGSRYTVVGVAPKGFNGLILGPAPGFWVPSAMEAQVAPSDLDVWTSRNTRGIQIAGRLGPDARIEQVDAELDELLRRSQRENGQENASNGVNVEPALGVGGRARGDVTMFVGIFLAAALLVLLIACVTVGNMLIARAVGRRREIAVRLAVGAGRSRLVRQLLVESTVLFIAGAGLGLLIAVWSLELLMNIKLPFDIPIEIDLSVDRTVLAATLLVALATGLLFGLAPALRASRPDLVTSLKENAAAVRGGRSLLRSTFVVAQVGLSLVLLVCSGLFLRTLQEATSIDPGFDPANVEALSIDASLNGYDEARAAQLYSDLLERVRSAPGIEHATFVKMLPLSGSSMNVSLYIDGAAPNGDEHDVVDVTMAAESYFATMGVPLRRGRDFTPDDRTGSRLVAVINEAMAERYWPGSDPIGKRISTEGPGGPWIDVVGVVATGRYNSLAEQALPFLYLPVRQHPVFDGFVVVRRNPSVASAIPTVRRELAALDPNMPIAGAAALADYTAFSLLPQRAAAMLSGTFGLVGLVLAAVGIYGLVAYSVSQRTHELGLRSALGASRRHLFLMVVRQGMLPVALGLALGIAGAFALSRLLASFLVGVTPTDPLTFAGVPLLLAAVALLATVIPAQRATRADPMSALRYE
jgi:predicted permease